MRMLSGPVDYSQGLPTPVGLGFISALMNSPVPSEVIPLRPDEVEKVKKWVEGPNALKRAQGLMKSAFHQITEGRPDPASRLVISAAVLAGYGWRENPDLASRIIETARRVVRHALTAKSGAAAGLGDDMLVLSELDPRVARSAPFAKYHEVAAGSLYSIAKAHANAAAGNYDRAIELASRAYEAGQLITQIDPDVGQNVIEQAKNIMEDAFLKQVEASMAGFSNTINYFDSKGTMWGSHR